MYKYTCSYALLSTSKRMKLLVCFALTHFYLSYILSLSLTLSPYINSRSRSWLIYIVVLHCSQRKYIIYVSFDKLVTHIAKYTKEITIRTKLYNFSSGWISEIKISFNREIVNNLKETFKIFLNQKIKSCLSNELYIVDVFTAFLLIKRERKKN